MDQSNNRQQTKAVNMQLLKVLQPLKEAAKTGGLFFVLMVWMGWLILTRQKWLLG